MFTVRIPIFFPKSDWMISVSKTALVQVASMPIKTRSERNITAITTPKSTTALRLKCQKSCARLRRIISTTYGGPAI